MFWKAPSINLKARRSRTGAFTSAAQDDGGARRAGLMRARLHPDVRFWSAFVLLNGLLFLPLYALNLDYTSFLPHATAENGPLNTFFGWRDNLDPFRINLELVLIITLWSSVAVVRSRVVRVLVLVVYGLTLAYYIYEGIVISLWQMEPVFYNHYHMALDGLGFLLENLRLSPLIYLGATVALGLVLWLLGALVKGVLVLEPDQIPGRWSRAVLAILSLAVLLSLAEYRTALADPRMVVSSVALKLDRNLDESRRVYASVGGIDDRIIRQAYDYRRYELEQRPNIHLIFVESYGSVLYKRTDYKVAYEKLLETLEGQYADQGWQVTTAMSQAPTWGGGSWMSYTSALFGLRIEEHPYYLSLFEKYQTADYPDLGKWLTDQGYYYLRASTLSKELKESLWDRYSNFYGIDEWIRYSDLNYVGQRYGWGPAPPDQYVLNFARARMMETNTEPYLFFYITQNSHYPWMPIPEIVEDWRTLNVPEEDQVVPDDDELEHGVRRMNYFNSIEYELEMISDFIFKQGTENDIFVLVGDHQPPRVSRRDDGFETPMHIISRNPDFVAAFEEYGFVDGFAVDTDDDSYDVAIKHEGFYSMFVRALMQTYGRNPERLPKYLPHGVLLPTPKLAE